MLAKYSLASLAVDVPRPARRSSKHAGAFCRVALVAALQHVPYRNTCMLHWPISAAGMAAADVKALGTSAGAAVQAIKDVQAAET